MRKELRLEWRNRASSKTIPKTGGSIPTDQLLALRDIIAEVGWAGALLYNERTGRLIDGHARKKIARKGEKLPVLVGSWTEEEERKILLTLDPIGSMAAADRTALDELIRFCQIREFSARHCVRAASRRAGLAKHRTSRTEGACGQLERADELKKSGALRRVTLGAGNHRIFAAIAETKRC